MQAPNPEAPAIADDAEQLPLGRLVSVTGGQAIVLLESYEDLPVDERPVRPDIGTLLKVDTSSSVILGLVSASSASMPSQNQEEAEIRVVEVEFIGELIKRADGTPAGFKRGISWYPGLGDPVRGCADAIKKAKIRHIFEPACDRRNVIHRHWA